MPFVYPPIYVDVSSKMFHKQVHGRFNIWVGGGGVLSESQIGDVRPTSQNAPATLFMTWPKFDTQFMTLVALNMEGFRV